MNRLAIAFLSAVALFAADDAWTKVKALKSGTEIRVFKHGTLKPIEGKLDEARESALVLVVKNEQVAVPKDSIDRMDYRPLKSAGRISTENKTNTEEPDGRPPVGMARGANVPNTSYSSSVSFGPKPEFETIYRRPPAAAPHTPSEPPRK